MFLSRVRYRLVLALILSTALSLNAAESPPKAAEPLKASLCDRESIRACLSKLSTSELKQMLRAAKELFECNRFFREKNSTIHREITQGECSLPKFKHYPTQGISDPTNYSQYYYHAHREQEHGHFHLFFQPKGIPESVTPLSPSPRQTPSPVHLVAISVSQEGVPIKLFTINRWTTGDPWYKSEDVQEMLTRYRVTPAEPYEYVSRSLNAIVCLFMPQIRELIALREQAVNKWRNQYPEIDPLEDRRLDILSQVPIDLELQIAVLVDILKEK